MERERLAAERVRLRAVRFWRGPKEGGFGGQCNQLRQSSAMVCCWSSSPRAGGEQPGRRLARKPAKRMWSVEGSEKCDKEGSPWFTPRHRGMLLLDRSSYLSTATVVSALAHVAGRPLSSANRRCAGDGRVPLCQCGHRGRFTLCNMARTMAEKAMRRVATIST